jgi:crotonobetainyl-CoA:carnitine CoA-transferase CaiB-like acyl-CoA transferase
LADELGEYCGKSLAGLGADVIKIEPPGGEETRSYGPFYKDVPHPNRSLYFWHYNFGKRSVVLDLDTEADQETFGRLARTADIIVDTRPLGYLDDRGIGYERLSADNGGLIYARISPFGDDGPWADFQSSDLVHLALGGVVMNCGYDATPEGTYDTPPIAPQMWQAYHIGGEQTAIAILAALAYRMETGRGQALTTSVHEAVNTITESDIPDWLYTRRPHDRRTCRHSQPDQDDPDLPREAVVPVSGQIAATKDGRWVLPYRTYLSAASGVSSRRSIVELLRKYGFAALDDPAYDDSDYCERPDVAARIDDLVERLIGSYTSSAPIWQSALELGLTWAPVRKPEENAFDDHWAQRETFTDVEYPELGETFKQVGARWFAPGLPWRSGPRAPTVGEHTAEILSEVAAETAKPNGTPAVTITHRSDPDVRGPSGSPFALAGVRVIDLGWVIASSGGPRFLAALGAEVIKVEHESRLDPLRWPNVGPIPDGGRAERDQATRPIIPSPTTSPNRSGSFMDTNAGKRSLSLNLKHPRGREILAELLRSADIVVDGYSPGTMERMGFGYEATLRELNPRLVYVQQSGFGQHGTYGRFRAFGPTAQAFSGLSEMSGLPSPYPPAGIGFSYLDTLGACNMAIGMLAGLYRQRLTGQGCWIDGSQSELGVYLSGTAVLDRFVNGREWNRFGNRSPHKPAAPSGVYRTAGVDRWIAISAFTESQWYRLARVLGVDESTSDDRLATLELRIANHDYLDALIGPVVERWDGAELMMSLQHEGIPAGICETAQDRCEWDPQLAHLRWLVELEQSEIGQWPVRDVPFKLSATASYVGGRLRRHGPSYGEDNRYVLGELLNLSESEIAGLERDGVL